MDVQKRTAKFTGKAAGSVLLTLAAALALWLFIAASHRKAAIEDIGKSLETINSYKTAEITAWLDDHNREALRLSRHPFLGEIISAEVSKPGSRRALLSAWLKDHTEQKQYASMAFLSPGKKIIAATPDYRIESNEEVAKHFRLALEKGTPQVTDIYLTLSGHPRIWMFSPISAGGRGGRPVCVLAIKIDLANRFYPILKAAPLFFTEAETLLVRKEGDKVLFLNPLDHRPDSALKFTRPLSEEHLPAAAALRGFTGFFQGVDYRGVRVFSAVGPVPGTDWAVITKVDRDTVIAPAKYKEQLYLAVILLAAALLYFLIYAIIKTRRHAAETALERSRHLLAETEKIGKVGGWEFNIDTRKQIWTEEVYRIHELDPAFDPDVERGINFYTPDSRPVIERALANTMKTGEGFDLELGIITAKGNKRTVHAIGKADLANRRVYGFFQDITERRQAETERQKIERIFNEFMKHSPVYVFFKDKDLRALHLSRNYEAMLGRPLSELLGKSMDELFPSDLAKSMIEDDKRIIKEGKEVVVEEEFNGRFYRTIKFPIKIEGAPSYLAGYTIDITEAKLAEEALKKSERELKEAQKLARLGNWALELPSNKLHWSDEIYAIFGIDKEKFGASYEAFLEAIHPEDREFVNKAYTDSLKTKSPYNITHRLLMRDGAVKYVSECCETFYDKEGKPLRSVGTVQDITERKLAEEKLRESEERLRITLEVTQIGTWDWNVETDTWSASPTYYTMLGYDPEQGPGDRQAWLDRVHPDDKDMIAAKIRGVLAGTEARYQYEARIRHADGTYRWQAVLGRTVKSGENGKAARIMGVRTDITERKQAEQKLRESEARYRALVDASGDGILTADLETMKFRFANRAICRMLGYTAEELTDLAVTDIHPKEALPAVIAEFEAQARGEKTLAPNLPCLRKDGSVFHADITTTPVTVDGRRCNLGVFRDITERKRNEELNGARLHLMEFSAAHGMDEMLEEALNKAEEITGSLIGFYHFIEADQKTLWLQNWSTRTKRDFCGAEGKGSHYSIDRAGVWTDCVRARKPVIHNDYASLPHKKGLPPGHAAVIRELVLPVMRGDKVVAIMGVGNKASDYTEKDIEALSPLADLSWEIVNRKRAEEALRESERLLRESQRQAHLGSYALDINTGLWKCSSILEEIFGINTAYPHTVEGWEALLHPDDRAMISAYLMNEVVGRRQPFDKEYRIVRQDTGAVRWVHGLGGLEFDANGRPVEMHGTIQDIHERKLAELELERLNRDLTAKRQEMENFLYITSHDLRTPLVNIQGFAQNLENYMRELVGELSPARLPREVNEAVSKLIGQDIPGALKFVLESSHKMDALINSLLKVARLGRVEMKPRDLDMNDTLKKVVDSTSYQLEEAGAAAKVGVLPPCKADPAAVSRIFANLLDNAIKYRAAARPLSVTITGETSGASVLYKIADNGSGIAEKDLGRVWDIFYRGKGGGEGEGIGLTVVKYMTEKNGGSIRAESEEDRGTVFYLELPAAGGTK